MGGRRREMKAVSVVVPCYNVSSYLEKCINHLLQQTIGIENIEIILVDDASTDNGATLDIIMKYEREYRDTVIAVSLEENMRQGGARNIGVSHATGEYLIFCDADDWLMPEALEHLYDAAQEYDADVVEFRIKNVRDHKMQIDTVEKGEGSFLTEIDTEQMRRMFLVWVDERLTLGSQKKLYRLSMLKENKIRFVEHRIFEEPSFVVPVRLFEKRHYFLDEELYICFLSPHSSMRGDWGEHKWDNPHVWRHLVKDLEARGLLKRYYSEMEYLFMSWGFGLSIRMVLQKGYVLTKDELSFLIDMVEEMFPNVRKNKYLMVGQDSWDSLMLTVLDLEITDESVKVINDILNKYV
ncbi:MAG: glycosyltransferase family 2 protein [Lachnospiraceae bacterium]|nr:glycosyltransferase family 2 protein [Lachnospiraceae bacterium]